MRRLKPPDWLIYVAVVAGLLFLALRGRETPAQRPPAPTESTEAAPPTPQEPTTLGPSSSTDPEVTVDVPERSGPDIGTGFSVASAGVWLTARHVVDDCKQTAIVISEGHGVEATTTMDAVSESAILETDGGSPALPLGLEQPLREGQLAFHIGFPQGKPGEVATRLIGRENMIVEGRGARTEPVLAWAEVGRSTGLVGSLGGLSGGPALDAQGRVVGVTIAEAPRRGRVYTTAPETTARLLGLRKPPLPAVMVSGVDLNASNYDQVGEALRKSLRVAEVVCLT